MNNKAACGEAASEEAALVLEVQQYFAQAKGHVGGSTMLVSGRRSKTGWASGLRRFVQTEIKTNTRFRDQKGSDLAPSKTRLANTIRESLGTK
jgi:hypothetical protein